LDPEQAEIFALDLVTGNQTSLLTDAMDPHYVETGHLLFMRRGTLMAVAFDPDRVVIEGQPVIVLEDVMQAVGMPNTGFESGSAQLAVSPAGHIAYASGGVYPERSHVLMRVLPGGQAELLALDVRGYLRVRGSPEGDRLAFTIQRGRASTVHVHDLVRGVTEQINTGGFSVRVPEWSPDGTSIAFSSDREEGVRNVYRMAVDSSGEPERLAPSDQSQSIASWSSQDVIAYLQGGDIWMLPADGEPAPFFTSDATEQYATFSPDGRWLAYVSDQTGESEVYVRPYPGPVPATRISSDGGRAPAWSRDGGQIYFLQPTVAGRLRASMMVVDVTPGDPFRVGPAESLIDPWPYRATLPVRSYDVLADGSFIVAANADETVDGDPRQQTRVSEFHVVLNFFEVLKERMGN
jgi:dipeptidyl aminopeptidase/acylaminoacyl peptidase